MLFWKKRLYADAAAATPLSPRVQLEMDRLFDLCGNPGGLHEEARLAKHEVESARARVAHTLGAHRDEILFVSGGTEANNLAILGVVRPLLRTHKKLHAVTSAIEHHSVLYPLRALKKEGLKLTELPVDSEGLVSPKALAEAITDKTVFVSVQLVNSEVGTIEPIREIAKEMRRIRAARAAATEGEALPLYFHTDAAQAPLWLPLGVEQLGVDLLSLDAQKIMGPKGIGSLYIRRGVSMEPLLWGGGQEGGVRGGTENVPFIGALAVALEDAQRHALERAERVGEVREHVWKEIQRLLPDAHLNGPHFPHRVANNLNISIPGLDGEMAVIALDTEGIAASTRSACAEGDEAPSHVIAALGTPKHMMKNAIRFSLLPHAKKNDAERIAQALHKVATTYRVVV